MHIGNLKTHEVETKEGQVQSQPRVCSEFETKLGEIPEILSQKKKVCVSMYVCVCIDDR